MAAALSNRSQGPKPAIDASPQALLERFRLKSELQSSTVDVVAAEADVPAAIARYLTAMKLPKGPSSSRHWRRWTGRPRGLPSRRAAPAMPTWWASPAASAPWPKPAR